MVPTPVPLLSSSPAHRCTPAPSGWILRHLPLALAGDGSRPVGQPPTLLDVACGPGRHLAEFAAHGARVTGVDRSPEAIAAAGDHGEAVLADIEGGPWPFEGRTFDIVVVTDYLWRPLLARIFASVAAGGVLLYETFAVGNETLGRPSRPDFLLRPGELLEAASAAGLRVSAFEDGYEKLPRECFVQRIAAVRQRAPGVVRLALPDPESLARMAG